jgi:hypothetical protein
VSSGAAVSSREAAVEVLALDAFNRADGVLVTRTSVDARLAELRAHKDTCGCGLCAAAQIATTSKVYWLASRWQWDIARTRDRAKR